MSSKTKAWKNLESYAYVTESDQSNSIRVSENSIVVAKTNGDEAKLQTFSFHSCKYELSSLEVIEKVRDLLILGFNCSIFLSKTFNIDEIINLISSKLFQAFSNDYNPIGDMLRLSWSIDLKVYEISGDFVGDLQANPNPQDCNGGSGFSTVDLSPSFEKLKAREHPENGIFIDGLLTKRCLNEEVLRVLLSG